MNLRLDEADRSYETAYNRLLARIRAETDKRPMCLPGTPELIDELIAQLERAEQERAVHAALLAECREVIKPMAEAGIERARELLKKLASPGAAE